MEWLALCLFFLQVYSGPAVVPLVALAALAAAFRLRRGLLDRAAWPARPVLLAMGAIVVYGFLSALWAENIRLALANAGAVAGIILCCGVLLRLPSDWDKTETRRFGTFLLVGFLIGLANLQFALATDGVVKAWLQTALEAVIGHQRPDVMPVALDTSMTLAGLLFWPVFLEARKRFGVLVGGLFYGATLMVILQGGSTTAKFAFAAAGLVFLVAWVFPRLAALGLAAGLSSVVAFAPLLFSQGMTRILPMVPGKENSLQHRRGIWDFVIERIADRPLLGFGIGNSRAVPGGHTEFAPGMERIPLHPHNAALQLWLELGGIGAGLGVMFILAVVWCLKKALPERLDLAAALAVFAMAAFHALASYNLWHEWWLAQLVATACFFHAVIRKRAA